tara:strand:+ start:329 stop:1444 length:1116 start_codon:yes stop_codon:yes gene_type:complete
MKYLYLVLISILFIACSNENGSSGDPIIPADNFSRTNLLENLTNNIIVPAHINLQSKLENLNNKLENFTSNQTPTNFSELRNSYVSTYIAWQSVEMFNIGLAEEIDYVKAMNTFPCNTTRINNNIIGQAYDLNAANWPSWTSQGLPALDYLLYGLDNDSNLVINNYTDPANGSKYLDYLNSIISQMKINTDDVVQYWQANTTSFIDSDANTSTSSLNLLTNDFIYYYEKGLRANKIGIPCGKWDNYQIYEIGVEAYYKKNISKQLALEALSACNDFFTGVGFNSNTIDGKSYVDYLTDNGDTNISIDIINGLDLAKDKIINLDDNFRLQLLNDNSSMLETYDALQKVVVDLKTDMLISMQITVDYVDADGD